jgi:hypothetical protein
MRAANSPIIISIISTDTIAETAGQAGPREELKL